MNPVVPGQPPTAFDTSASHLSKAGDIYSTLGVEGGLSNINQYLNPYYDQVLNSALGRMQTNFNQQRGQVGDQAIAAGAFGGSRHGVMEGVLAGEYNKNVGDLTARTMADGFNTATGLAMQDAGLKMNAGSALTQLGGNYFDIGRTIQGDQMQQGTMQQQLLQTILSGGDAAFQDYLSNPYKMIDLFQSIMAADPRRAQMQATTQSTPGLYDYLSLGAQAMGGA
jgi:hypothetical protein